MPTSETKPASTRSPLAEMRMSPEALSNMRSTERAILRYYNDMGKTTGNCTWGIGFYAHKGVCTPEELQRKVAAPSIHIEYAKRVAEAERRVKLKVKVPLNQDQFDGLVSFTYNTKNQINQHVYDKINGSDFPGAARLMSQVTRVTVDGKPKLAPRPDKAPFRRKRAILDDSNRVYPIQPKGGAMTSLTCLMLRAPMVKIFKTSALMLALGSPMLCHAGHPGDEVIGKWKFSGILDLAEMTSLDEKGARKLVGRVMTIRKDGTRFDGEVCQPPDFETKRVEPNLYLQKEAGVGNTKLRLPNPVTVVDISCTQVYIKKRNRAVIFWNGFFFDAVKVAR